MQVSCTDALKSLKMCLGLRFFDAWACKTCKGSPLLEEHMKRGCTRSVRPKSAFCMHFTSELCSEVGPRGGVTIYIYIKIQDELTLG